MAWPTFEATFRVALQTNPPLAGLAAAGAAVAVAAVVLLLRRIERRREAELQTLAALALAISSAADDAAEVAEAAYVHTSRLFPADFFQLGLFQDEVYRTLIWIRDGDRLRNREFTLDSEHQGLIGWIRTSGKPLLVRDFRRADDLPARPSYSSDDPPLSGLFVPILVDNTVIGVLAVQSRRTAAFRRRELLLLRALAGGLGTALAALAWRDELRLRERQLALIEDVTGLLTPLRPLADGGAAGGFDDRPELGSRPGGDLPARWAAAVASDGGRGTVGEASPISPRSKTCSRRPSRPGVTRCKPVRRRRDSHRTWECAAPLRSPGPGSGRGLPQSPQPPIPGRRSTADRPGLESLALAFLEGGQLRSTAGRSPGTRPSCSKSPATPHDPGTCRPPCSPCFS